MASMTEVKARNNNLQQIFSRCIEKFDYLDGGENNENYKWGIAKRFRELMEVVFRSMWLFKNG